MSNIFNNQNEDEVSTEISKTKRKEQMNDLQDLGIELVKLGKEKLAKLDLPSYLLDAIKEAQRLTANGAIRRQYQYIGKLMRKEIDADDLRKKIAYLNGDSIEATRNFHLAEKWRDKLLETDSALDEFITEYSGFDIGELRSLLRIVRREREHQQNKNFTKLFRLIKVIIEGGQQ